MKVNKTENHHGLSPIYTLKGIISYLKKKKIKEIQKFGNIEHLTDSTDKL